MSETMDPIIHDLAALRLAGIDVQRVPEPWLDLYVAPGFPELTRSQVMALARQRGNYNTQPANPALAPCTPC